MGSSAKKKREKKKDFQKPKLKVGKARPKALNQTDTSFRAKAIVLNQQLNIEAPSIGNQFLHHVSLLSSKSDQQRRDSLAFLSSSFVSSSSSKSTSDVLLLPLATSGVLDKACPLILDGAGSVRSQVLKLMQALPAPDVRDQVGKILPYVRAGITHLSRDIRLSAVEMLSWLIRTAGAEIVTSAGGWYKTLECFTTVLGWRSLDPNAKWSTGKASLGSDPKATARVMQVLAEFLQAGLWDDTTTADDGQRNSGSAAVMASNFPLWHTECYIIPTKSNAYAYLNLFGPPQDRDDQMLEDREDRIHVYDNHFGTIIEAGIEAAKKEGGELGRGAGILVKTLGRVQKG